MSKGFTLIEMVIVLFIMSVAIVGVYSAFSLMIILSTDAFDQLQAAYLSQEGIEVVRNIRDSNWLNGFGVDPQAWVFGLADDSTDCSAGCELDYTTAPLEARYLLPFSSGGNPLNIDQDGFYSYSTVNTVPTKFKRRVTITQLDANAISVTVDTLWQVKPSILYPTGGQQVVTVKEILYNWY